MNNRQAGIWLAVICLLAPLSAMAQTSIDTQSLRLQFSAKGDLISAEACFPSCSKARMKTRVLSAGQGMLVFEQDTAPGWQFKRELDDSTTILTFTDTSGDTERRWSIPGDGWLITVSSRGSAKATLASGEDFRPLPSSGFGNLLEQTRYLLFDGDSVESVGLDESDQVHRLSQGWFGFRNRFWTAMVLPETPLAITPLTGEQVEDASVVMQVENQDLEFSLDLYLGPIEPSALSKAAPALESLMYSGLWFWLRWICQALYFLLNGIAMVVPQWGLAVMVLSLVVGILMRPLSKIADRLQDQVCLFSLFLRQ